jgi:predicted aspartyl protease
MIVGTVNSRHEVVIPFSIRDSAGQQHPIEALLDRGYTAYLSLPPLVIGALGLTWKSKSYALLADGALKEVNNYAATIVWDGQSRDIVVQAVDNVPMLGLDLMAGFDLRARFIPNGRVEIIPPPLG